jgi:hypothetical protein
MSLTDFQQCKQKLRILILGAYKPTKTLKRLEGLRDCLIARGFGSARLAKDFPDRIQYGQDSDEHFTIKSRKLIEDWAHVPIFVFFKKADNQGVSSEITHACLRLFEKQSCCVVFFECGLKGFSTQIKGSVKITKKISYETFSNDRDLCNLSAGHSLKMLDRLFYYL